MAGLSSVSQVIEEKLYLSSLALSNEVTFLDTKLTPFFALIAANGGLEYIDSYQWGENVLSGRDANEAISRYTDITDPSAQQPTRIEGSLAKFGRLIRYDDDELPTRGLPSKANVRIKTMRGLEDTTIGMEEDMVGGSGTGASNSLAGLRTWTPMSDSGAIFNIPATRSNFTSDILHHWATTSSCGARTSAELGAGFVLTDFCNADSGAYATLIALKDESIARGFSEFWAFCSGRFMRHLKKMLKDEGMIKADNVEIGTLKLPKELSQYAGGLTGIRAGGSFIKIDDITFIRSKDLYTTTYDVICVPFRKGSAPTTKIKFTKPNTEEPIKMEQKLISIHKFQRSTKGTALYAPIVARPQLVIPGVNGYICMKYDGVYDSSIA